MDDDLAIIKKLGGATRVAELLGYNKRGGAQRVHNWGRRGIPTKVRLEHPELFSAKSAARTPALA